MPLRPRLQVRLFDNNLTTPTLIDELTERVGALRFGTALNGGFKTCTFTLPTTIGQAWLWLSREGKRGYHFNRITVHEDQTLVWEGRIMEVELLVQSGEQSIRVTAMGYWSACRDQFYTATGNTDWTSGSHTIDDIIKEMLGTDFCPDINTDQTNITATSRDVVGLDLTTKEYPQARINELTNLSDSDGKIWFFAIWDNRIPYLTARAATTVDWYVWLADLGNLSLQQSALGLRNVVLPYISTTEGTTQTDATSLLLYPRREEKLSLTTGTNANTQADAASGRASEQALPRQAQSFDVTGRIYRTTGDSGGRLEEAQKWRVRAGDVIRINDLVPTTAATPALDDVRTFFVMETDYNAQNDTLRLQPDRRGRSLSSMVAKLRA
jgi:hypothetical protein